MELNKPSRGRSESFGYATDAGLTVAASHPHVTVEILRYLRLYRQYWKRIALLVFVAMSTVAVYDLVFATYRYQGTATITPVPPSDYDLGVNGGLSGLLSSGGGGGGSGLSSLLSGGSDNEMISENYMSIMNSFDFTMNLVKRYHLMSRMIAKESSDAASMTPWDVYKRINKEFDTDYDYKSGNLTITYIDQDPAMAREVVGYYLQALQDKLRAEEMQSASIAAKSLQEEVSHTSDSLLQQQLYQLMAYQIQREKLAQLQANFAFKVIEPPMVPDHKYSPHTLIETLLAGVVVIFFGCVYLTFREWIRIARDYLHPAELPITPLSEVISQVREDSTAVEKIGGARFR
jgi:uncharacterized protein involved in exopolysaccharide biosynthesis